MEVRFRHMNTPRIVVVDDDEGIRSMVAAIAHETMPSATITTHASSLRAFQDIHRDDADLLITECYMPNMDGPTLVKAIRHTRNAIPIIMISGSEKARELGEKAGIDEFVPKSHMHSALTEAIQSLLAA
jgi:CheY-like chemotaxis protein